MQQLTTSKELRAIGGFMLPIVAGNFLQQFYTLVDSLIVGRCLGKNGLAAVGIAGSFIAFLIFIVLGIRIGMTVLLAKYSGEWQQAHYRRVSVTALSVGLVAALFMSGGCLLFPHAILTAFQTPDVLMEDSVCYLRIMSVGLLFSFLYNHYNALLLSLGDSRTPFLALAVASVTNVGLTWLLTCVLGLGVAGAALGSVCAQGVSFGICLLYLKARRPELVCSLRDLCIDRACLLETFQYGGASALQKVLFHGGKLLIQGAVNTLPVGVIAGYSVAVQIEEFILSAMDGVGTATSRYCARQSGQGDSPGAVRAFFAGAFLSVSLAAAIAGLIYCCSPGAIGLFTKENAGADLAAGVLYLRIMSPCYLVLGVSDILQALLRGLGRMDRAILATILQMVFRVGITYLFLREAGLAAICYGTLAGWLSMVLYNGPFAWKWAFAGKSPGPSR